ncbi:NAD(P)/FAD-dependent oxidoreductase [Fontisphaera persica]|uniref:NAD(P)/FAD-dependent oxidoreductase n=1 Tax=Fontisphaera persica TaxID=2974023 RepID=UPI0024C00899|nr:NAD(P)/FAD-dependent oxidoreductase [Fontisphaera persica]WCJ58692.1 NAD(P)/FAD-dependent oxidoreductase [Fontisphaera persica]
MKTQHIYDAVVIGAGPSGSTAAALLAEYGHRVLVLEREKFPRYHIGESLLPFTYYPLRRLGLTAAMHQAGFVKKYSVQFVSPSGKASQPFYFFTRYEAEVAQTWQVLRSEFDLLLMNNARAKGAEVREQTTVLDLLREDGRVVGVRAAGPDGREYTVRARLTLDASGRDALAAGRFNWRVRDPYLKKFAVWTYYEGIPRPEGIDAGATTVAFLPQKGWFWYIPLHGDRISVGAVAEGPYLTRDGVREPEKMFQREIQNNAWIAEQLSKGRQVGPYWLTNEFSYRSRYGAVDGLVMLGDAFGFLDPVFSSGVMLALKSGMLAADAGHAALQAGDVSAARFTEYSRLMREGIENMRKLVYAFYQESFSFRDLTDKYPEVQGDITDCLSGDVNKDLSRLFERVAEFAEVPEPLPYGEVLTAEEAVAAK